MTNYAGENQLFTQLSFVINRFQSWSYIASTFENWNNDGQLVKGPA